MKYTVRELRAMLHGLPADMLVDFKAPTNRRPGTVSLAGFPHLEAFMGKMERAAIDCSARRPNIWNIDVPSFPCRIYYSGESVIEVEFSEGHIEAYVTLDEVFDALVKRRDDLLPAMMRKQAE